MVLNSHYESCNNFKMVLNSHYESCNNFEMVMIFAEKHRTYDGIGMFIDQCKREAISNIFQTNKFNFSTFTAVFLLFSHFFSFPPYRAVEGIIRNSRQNRISFGRRILFKMFSLNLNWC